MKYKLAFVIIISAALITGCVLELYFVNKDYGIFIEKLDEMLAQDGEYLMELALETEAWLKKENNALAFVIPYNHLNELSISYGEYMGALLADDMPSATALLYKTKELALRLKGMASVTIQNIV